MSTILEEIIAHKATEVATAKSKLTLADLEASFPPSSTGRGFFDALEARVSRAEAAVIAEIKKASPSKGLIREDFHPAEIAKDYAANGATCLSVLTDEKYFQGHNNYLQQARSACDLPVIRKDFMIDTFQVAESKALGADCILLIVAALQQDQMEELAAYASEIGLDILVEVHNQEELNRALNLPTDLIGINNRNLHTFETDLSTTLELAKNIPAGKIVITESGINTSADVKRMMGNGIYAFLIGESFMRADSPGTKLREIMFAS